MAVRDELIALVGEVLEEESPQHILVPLVRQNFVPIAEFFAADGRSSNRQFNFVRRAAAAPSTADDKGDAFYLPQIGVEIVDSEERHGNTYHSIRDLRNGRVIKNVTRKGARKLWSYAIEQHEDNPAEPAKIQWKGDVGLVHSEKRAGKLRYDLALRENGDVRVFYGVTEDGMEGRWSVFVQDE